MKKVDKRWNLSNQTSYNDVPCKENEVLIPVVLSDDMIETLNSSGFNKQNARTWGFKGAKEKVPVAFVPCHKKFEKEGWKEFNRQVSDYLKWFKYNKNEVSLDEILDNINDEDKLVKDPTGTTKYDEIERYEYLLEDILQRLEKINPTFSRYVFWKVQGYNKGEIIEMLDLGVKKSQAYDKIKKIEKEIFKIINEEF